MSPQKQFRLLQRKLDDLGYMTSINRIIAGKRYEVIVNGVIEKNYKQRKSTKLLTQKIKLNDKRHNHRFGNWYRELQAPNRIYKK